MEKNLDKYDDIDKQLNEITKKIQNGLSEIYENIRIEYKVENTEIRFKISPIYKKYKYWTIIVSDYIPDYYRANYFIKLYWDNKILRLNIDELNKVIEDLLKEMNKDYCEYKKDMIKLENLAKKIDGILSDMEFKFDRMIGPPNSVYYNNIKFFYNDSWYGYLYGRISDHPPHITENRVERINLTYYRNDETFYIDDEELEEFKNELIAKRNNMIKQNRRNNDN
jgi:tetrahydromethanopterin S-methyltransferase subunit G